MSGISNLQASPSWTRWRRFLLMSFVRRTIALREWDARSVGVLLLLPSLRIQSMPSPTDPNISLEALAQGLHDGSIVLVDVREAHEYAAGHIPGAVLMPLSSFDPAALPLAEGKRIVFACQAGKRSMAALQQAQAAGRDVAGHYAGGF